MVAKVLAVPYGRARSAYDGRPGHPVLIGRGHLEPLIATLHGDVGARPYLDVHDVTLVECADRATGVDVDHR